MPEIQLVIGGLGGGRLDIKNGLTRASYPQTSDSL